jgi:peptide-methionine (S)-S-oxide reductase
METLVLGGGCFWCTEAVFQRVKGVHKVVSGYSGGKYPNPTYREICEGNSGHAEVIEIIFDAQQISVEELLIIFFHTHDPTTLNRQGNDVGSQYRSVIFYHSADQKTIAEFYKTELQKSGAFENEIVTEIVPAAIFYEAEKYHQNYFNQNGDQPYCQFVIRPKVEKFQKAFKNKLK